MEVTKKIELINKIKEAYRNYDMLPTDCNRLMPYSIDGFIGKATELRHMALKVGIAAGFRCLHLQRHVGVYVGAGKEMGDETGLKFIDPNGLALDQKWELEMETLCNIVEPVKVTDYIDELIRKYAIRFHPRPLCFRVLTGRDERPCTQILNDIVQVGIDFWKPLTEAIDYDQATVPLTHWLIGEGNRRLQFVTVGLYYLQIAQGMHDAMESYLLRPKLVYKNRLFVDAANSVVAYSFRRLMEDENWYNHIDTILCNFDYLAVNDRCGAHQTFKTHRTPKNIVTPNEKCVSIDADGSRLVYFYLAHNDYNYVCLLDGDKIGSLIVRFFMHHIYYIRINRKVHFGVVHTAYTNSKCNEYLIQDLGILPTWVLPGERNLMNEARKYDIGVYFEPDGRVSVMLSNTAINIFADMPPAQQLLSLIVNYTSDAVSNVAMVETCLRYFDWDIHTWDSQWVPKPHRTITSYCKNASAIKTANALRHVTAPRGIQEGFEYMVSCTIPGARMFVHPDGKNDMITVHAEAHDFDTADKLATDGTALCIRICGNLPSPPPASACRQS